MARDKHKKRGNTEKSHARHNTPACQSERETKKNNLEYNFINRIFEFDVYLFSFSHFCLFVGSLLIQLRRASHKLGIGKKKLIYFFVAVFVRVSSMVRDADTRHA